MKYIIQELLSYYYSLIKTNKNLKLIDINDPKNVCIINNSY